MNKTVLMIVGTRADAIKMAPVIEAIRADSDLVPLVVATSQHREMLDQVLNAFDLSVDIDLDIMRHRQTLTDITVRAIEGLDRVFAEHEVDLTIVQGDTTTSFVGGLLSFYHGKAVAHVEAGLRTYDLSHPFPEEANRRLLDALSTLLFPPTERAKKQLLAENLPEDAMLVTGNTAIDSLLRVAKMDRPIADPKIRAIAEDGSRRLVIVTAHRRESFGEPFQRLIGALKRIAAAHPDVDLVYPVHLNPNVDVPVREALTGIAGVHLVPPMDYLDFTKLMAACDFVLTDSGGIQEEAPALGKPVVVLREVTERPEGIEAGVAKLVGTDEDAIVAAASELLRGGEAYRRMSRKAFLYGDGKASERIRAVVRKKLGLDADEPEPFVPWIEEN